MLRRRQIRDQYLVKIIVSIHSNSLVDINLPKLDLVKIPTSPSLPYDPMSTTKNSLFASIKANRAMEKNYLKP